MVNLIDYAESPHYAEIANFDLEDIERFNIRARFFSISRIVDQLNRDCPAPQNDPNAPVDRNIFRNELMALVRISETMRHTNAYYEWIDRCNNYLAVRLESEKRYVTRQKNWNNIKEDEKIFSLRLRHTAHNNAANQTINADIKFPNSPLKTFNTPRREDRNPKKRTIIHGESRGRISPSFRSSSYINTNEASSFQCAVKANKTGHHEINHDFQLYFAFLYRTGDSLDLKEYAHDAELIYYHHTQRATIPSRMRVPYRTQFHEKSAYYAEDQMESFYRKISTPPLSP